MSNPWHDELGRFKPPEEDLCPDEQRRQVEDFADEIVHIDNVPIFLMRCAQHDNCYKPVPSLPSRSVRWLWGWFSAGAAIGVTVWAVLALAS